MVIQMKTIGGNLMVSSSLFSEFLIVEFLTSSLQKSF